MLCFSLAHFFKNNMHSTTTITKKTFCFLVRKDCKGPSSLSATSAFPFIDSAGTGTSKRDISRYVGQIFIDLQTYIQIDGNLKIGVY